MCVCVCDQWQWTIFICWNFSSINVFHFRDTNWVRLQLHAEWENTIFNLWKTKQKIQLSNFLTGFITSDSVWQLLKSQEANIDMNPFVIYLFTEFTINSIWVLSNLVWYDDTFMSWKERKIEELQIKLTNDE